MFTSKTLRHCRIWRWQNLRIVPTREKGVAPLQRIVNKLAEKGYSRALSLELFDPVVQNTDPEVVARKGIETITPFINR